MLLKHQISYLPQAKILDVYKKWKLIGVYSYNHDLLCSLSKCFQSYNIFNDTHKKHILSVTDEVSQAMRFEFLDAIPWHICNHFLFSESNSTSCLAMLHAEHMLCSAAVILVGITYSYNIWGKMRINKSK